MVFVYAFDAAATQSVGEATARIDVVLYFLSIPSYNIAAFHSVFSKKFVIIKTSTADTGTNEQTSGRRQGCFVLEDSLLLADRVDFPISATALIYVSPVAIRMQVGGVAERPSSSLKCILMKLFVC